MSSLEKPLFSERARQIVGFDQADDLFIIRCSNNDSESDIRMMKLRQKSLADCALSKE
jgi:hypothetical protein